MTTLEASIEASNLRAVKAVQVRLAIPGAAGRNGGAVVGISIKFPSTRTIASKHGLLVHQYEDEPGIAVQGDLLNPRLARPRPAGLYMTEGLRVLSITPYNVRLCRTGAISYSYAWGCHDWRYPQGLSEPVELDAEALASLAP